MRCLGFLLFLLFAAPFASAQTPAGGGDKPAEIVVKSDWDRILGLYQQVHGGPERLAEMKLISFDFVPSIFDSEGKEVKSDAQKVEIRFFNTPSIDQGEAGPSKPIPRAVRVESQVLVDEKKVKTISIVKPGSARVWIENEEGAFEETNIRELRLSAANDANALLSHLDLILMPDSEELLFRFVGLRKRDGANYAAVEAEFIPTRGVFQLYRNYHSSTTSLIERMDIYDPVTKKRIGCTRISGYEDHGGIKFPRVFKSYDRNEKPVGTWTLSEVQVNPELTSARFEAP